MARTLDISFPILDEVSEESYRLAKAEAREAALVLLQQRGELTIREAAMDLGLTYEGYLDLLVKKGLPASNCVADPALLEALSQQLRQREDRQP